MQLNSSVSELITACSSCSSVPKYNVVHIYMVFCTAFIILYQSCMQLYAVHAELNKCMQAWLGIYEYLCLHPYEHTIEQGWHLKKNAPIAATECIALISLLALLPLQYRYHDLYREMCCGTNFSTVAQKDRWLGSIEIFPHGVCWFSFSQFF